MEISLWIAKLMGPIILVLGIPMAVTPDRIHDMARKFIDNIPLIFFSGVLVMAAGLSIVNTHNVWVTDWRVVITIFGWLMTIGGAVRIMAPQLVVTIGSAMLEHTGFTRIAGVLWALLGVYLTYQGYW